MGNYKRRSIYRITMKAYRVDNGLYHELWVDNGIIAYKIADKTHDKTRWVYFDHVVTKIIPFQDIVDHHGFTTEEIKLTHTMESKLFMELL